MNLLKNKYELKENDLIEVIDKNGFCMVGIFLSISEEKFMLVDALKAISGPMQVGEGKTMFITSFLPIRSVGKSKDMLLEYDNFMSISKVKNITYRESYNEHNVHYDEMFKENGKVKNGK